MLQAVYLFATFIGLMLILIRAFRHFDRLVQIEHDRYPDRWLYDGEPSGFFWNPPEASLGGVQARHRLSLAWVFKPPVWMYNDLEANTLIKRLRFYLLVWNLGLIIWFLTLVSLA